MTSLNEYLAGEFADFDRERREIDGIIEKTIKTLESLFDTGKGWPYEVSLDEPAEAPKTLSTSTASMISGVLAAAVGKARKSILSHHVDWQPEKRERKRQQDEDTLKTARKALALVLNAAAARAKEKNREVFTSRTFGPNDVFTLCWLLDLHGCVGDSENELDEIISAIAKARPELVRDEPQKQAASEHAFPLLRILEIKRDANERTEELEKRAKDKTKRAEEAAKQSKEPKQSSENAAKLAGKAEALGQEAKKLAEAAKRPHLKELRDVKLSEWQQEFSRRVHAQLSFHVIPDSRFDPAELAFALEGLVLASGSALDRGVIERVFTVLREAQTQKNDATLRPTRPFRSDPSGQTLFPVSVETFNSLLRTKSLLASHLEPEFGRRTLVDLCRRYYGWVRPRLVDGGNARKDVYGWHSEHINNPRVAHPWETSQVLLFLLGYRTLLDQHLAAEALRIAGLSVQPATRKPEAEAVAAWKKIVARQEPVDPAAKPELAVYASIEREFRNKHASGQPLRYSMMLYGPPGTGKTGLAKDLAKALRYPLITVTVSDFLAEGGLQIEARAKDVFTVLTAQKRSVIIFDEIDQMLLDRNSDQYEDLDSVMKLLVPGMLTKIKDLRDAERSIFIIGTNYAERIDSAIKRPGRIDKSYLLMPPDWDRRAKIVRAILEDYSKDVTSIDPELIEEAVKNITLLARTARMSFTEMKGMLHDVLAGMPDEELAHAGPNHKLIAKLNCDGTYPEPVANLLSYIDRRPTSKLLTDEADALLGLTKEAENKSKPRLDLGSEAYEEARHEQKAKETSGAGQT